MGVLLGVLIHCVAVATDDVPSLGLAAVGVRVEWGECGGWGWEVSCERGFEGDGMGGWWLDSLTIEGYLYVWLIGNSQRETTHREAREQN